MRPGRFVDGPSSLSDLKEIGCWVSLSFGLRRKHTVFEIGGIVGQYDLRVEQ